MRGVLLGGAARARPRTLIVPGVAEEREVVGRCLVPGCGLKFYAGEEEAWQRHVGRCARANMDRIKARIESLSVFEDYDPEVSEYLQKVVGPRMLAEGRLEVKPNERTGTV